MDNFWCTSDNIPKGLGFSQFETFHLIWLAVMVITIVANCMIYRRLGDQGRRNWKRIVALLLIADELFKLIPMFVFDTFRLSYLPFHLCSINLFIIGWHAVKPNKLLDNFLYTVCIPGALAALLFPSWTKLPAWNYMCIHSFTVHILLVMYPVVLTATGEIKPRLKELPKTLLLLLGMAVLAYCLNLWWDTNFMFLIKADKGNPLYWFQENWGSHLLGFPVIIAAVIVVLYLPIELYHKFKKAPVT